MTVGQLVLIVIGIGWLVYTYYTVQTLRRKHYMRGDLATLNLAVNVISLLAGLVFLLINYWDLVIV